MEAKEFSAICPLDFDTVFDAYNYAMSHRLDERSGTSRLRKIYF